MLLRKSPSLVNLYGTTAAYGTTAQSELLLPDSIKPFSAASLCNPPKGKCVYSHQEAK